MHFSLIFFILVSSFAQAFTLVIDPGHGGKFDGAVSVNGLFKEKDMTLDIALRLGSILEKQDITIVYTRKEDKNLADDLKEDLLKRVEIAREAKADLFISIHLNSSRSSPESRGFELYVPMVSEFPLESYRAASFIHYHLSQKREKEWAGSLGNLNHFDRGIRAARFNVLIHNPCPAVLIELGYISNSTGEEQFSKPEYRDTIAQIVADGVIDFYMSCKI